MTALGEWLKQLILIVLFAVFAEMLLPTKALERYIRMVLGLALIATMLQPLGILLQKDWASQLAQQAVSEITKSEPQNSAVTNSLGSVQSLQKQMSQEQQAQANQLLEKQLASGILEKFGFQPESVVVSGAGSNGNFRVHVVLSQAQMSRASPIAKWIGSELGLNQSSIRVDTGGGG